MHQHCLYHQARTSLCLDEHARAVPRNPQASEQTSMLRANSICLPLRYTAHISDWSADGRLCAYGAHNSVILLDPTTKTVAACLTGHTGRCHAARRGHDVQLTLAPVMPVGTGNSLDLNCVDKGLQSISRPWGAATTGGTPLVDVCGQENLQPTASIATCNSKRRWRQELQD